MATHPAAATSTARPASLTEWLRGRTDDELAELLRRRPDLALPAPADLAALASRVSVRTSVQRAVDGLDAFTLRVLDGLLLAAGDTDAVPVAAAREQIGAEFDRGLAELLELALVWSDGASVYLLATVRDAIGPYPAGLGRPAAVLLQSVPDAWLAPVLRELGLPAASQPAAGQAVAGLLADPSRLAELLAASDATEREILGRLAAGPPVGVVRDLQSVAAGSRVSPPLRLIARGLLVPVDAQTVELPREVGQALRVAGAVTPVTEPPAIATVHRSPAELDRLGSTAVLETLRLVELLGENWTNRPPAVLRSGGVGVRELRRTAHELGVDETTAALIAETSYAAGLIGATSGIDPVYLPTSEFDGWLGRNAAERWTVLADAWLSMTRQPSLISQRGDRDRLITALGPDVERGTTPALRTRVLDVLTELPPGAAPVDADAVLARLAWQAPRRAGGQRQLAQAILAEADLLGVTAAGGLTGYSRTLLHGSRAVAEQVLLDALPEPVDYVLVQPDLTVVVPGPPTADLGVELSLAADLESTGGANVYRITEATVRRALDAGRSGAELLRLLTERSRTPVPQALQYLITDVARRHGVLRAGAALAYLRCDDEGLLARVVAERGTESLQLRRNPPTVAISAASVAQVLEVLRSAGFAPAAEAPDGQVLTLGAEPARAPARPPARPLRSRAATVPGAHLAELVRRIRSGDAPSAVSQRVAPIARQLPGVTSAATMGLLREAIREGRRVRLGYAADDGSDSRHVVLPISMAAGVVRGHESRSPGLQAFALHRITAVGLLDEDGDDAP